MLRGKKSNKLVKRKEKENDQNINVSQKSLKSKNLQTVKERLDYYFYCLENQCDEIPNDDPRMYDITVGQYILREVKELRLKKVLDSEERRLMNEAMKMMNGHVQAEAIKYFENQPVSSQNLRPIIIGLNNSEYDDILMQKATSLLSNYFKNPETSDQVFHFVTSQIRQGSFLSGRYFAKKLNLFLNKDNFKEVQQIYNELPKGKSNRKFVESVIENFKLMTSRG